MSSTRNPEELDKELVSQLRDNLKQYSKHLSISLGFCFMVLIASFAGFKDIALVSIKIEFIWGSILCFLASSVFMIFAKGEVITIDELYEDAQCPYNDNQEETEKWLEKYDEYEEGRRDKLNDILRREPVLFHPFSLTDEVSIGSFILLILSIIIPPVVYYVVQYISIDLMLLEYFSSSNFSDMPTSAIFISFLLYLIIFSVYLFSYGDFILHSFFLHLQESFERSTPREIIAAISLLFAVLSFIFPLILGIVNLFKYLI